MRRRRFAQQSLDHGGLDIRDVKRSPRDVEGDHLG
jgi:hypothetical protein